MFLNVILMIYLDRKVSRKSRNVQNLKEVIIGLKCLFLFLNYTKEVQKLSALGEVKFVENAKVQEIKEDSFMNALLVVEQGK